MTLNVLKGRKTEIKTYCVYFLQLQNSDSVHATLKRHVTGVQLLHNFVYIYYKCVTKCDIKIIG